VLVKSSLEVEAPVSGLLVAMRVPAGATFARGQALAVIETE
jgi:pyruvate/2-oxoglutarate dehydrogenase complex dihydrolipoamide acyltransferase (E2) component